MTNKAQPQVAAQDHLAEIHAAATILLKGHIAATNKEPHDRTKIEQHVAQMGRNRLKEIIRLSDQIRKER